MGFETPNKKNTLDQGAVELLERQGLHADIRNKLGPVSNMITLLEAIEKNPEKTDELKALLQAEIVTAKESVEHILLALAYDEGKKK